VPTDFLSTLVVKSVIFVRLFQKVLVQYFYNGGFMRKRMSKRHSRKSFSRAAGSKKINHKPAALGRRGGIRL